MRDKLRTDNIWRQIKAACSITRALEHRALKWCGHCKRIAVYGWSKRITEWSPQKGMEKGLSEGNWNDRLLSKQQKETKRTPNSVISRLTVNRKIRRAFLYFEPL